ncbi:hypothetical protein [Actinacidiphila alni]|nr:hypothetical protein [Actinacidiphila alni]
MTDGPGQQPQPPQEPPTSAPEGEREVLEGRVIPSRSQPRHAAAQPPQPPRQQSPYDAAPGAMPSPATADDPRRPFRQDAGSDVGSGGSAPQAPSAGPAWSPPAQGEQGAYQIRPGVPERPAPQPHPSLPPGGAAPQSPQAPTGQAPGQAPAGQAAPAGPGTAPAATASPAAGPTAPAAPGRDDAPQGAPGMGTHRQPFPRRPRQQAGGAHSASRAGGRPPGAGQGPETSAGTPDWNALADEQTARGARRRKLMLLGGGILAVVVIAGAVAAAVVKSGGSDDDKSIAGPSSSASATGTPSPLPPTPTFSSVAPPPPPNPLDFISTAAKDTAPINPTAFFPSLILKAKTAQYDRVTTAMTDQCDTGARSDLATALKADGCKQLVRATFTRGGVAVTVGVAVFDDAAHAVKVQKTAHYLAPLYGGGVKDFCRGVSCQMTSNAVGRYAYFTIAGFKNGKTLTKADKTARQAANDASDYAFQRIIQRGRDAAAKSTATP